MEQNHGHLNVALAEYARDDASLNEMLAVCLKIRLTRDTLWAEYNAGLLSCVERMRGGLS